MEKPESGNVTDQPLSAFSTMLRRFAYKYNESGIGHWMPLIFATKINIWERFLHNFRRGLLPKFRLKNKERLIKNSPNKLPVAIAVRVLVTTFVIAALFTAVKKKKKSVAKG